MTPRSRVARVRDSCRSPARGRDKRSASHGMDELLDVNALKLSHSYHSKPPQDHKLVRTVLLRTLFFPLSLGWWKQQLGSEQAYRWLGVYCSLWAVIAAYHAWYSRVFAEPCLSLKWSAGLCSELQESLFACAYTPLVLCAVVAVGYGRAVGATSNPKTRLEQSSSRHFMSAALEADDDEADLTEDSDDEAERISNPVNEPPSADVSLATVDEDELDEVEHEAWGFVLREPIKVSVWNTKRQERKVYMTFYQLRTELADRTSIAKDDTPVASSVIWPGSALSAVAPWLVVTYLAYLEFGAASEGSAQAMETLFGEVIIRPAASWSDKVSVVYSAFGWTAWQLCGFGAFLLLCGAIIVHTSYVVLYSLAYAEAIYLRRFHYAKFFAALASSRKAKAHGLPHFALKSVPSIKVWLALRAGRTWLRKHRSQRIADSIASSSFMLVMVLFVLLSVLVIRKEGSFMRESVHGGLMCWCVLVSHFVQRYLWLSSKIEKKYNDHSVLLTEQINLQLRILQVSAQIREETALLKVQQQLAGSQPPRQLVQEAQFALRQANVDGDTEPEAESVDLDDDLLDETATTTTTATTTSHPAQQPLAEDQDKLELLILKKERLQVANTVLKLALKLLKELDSPARSQVLMNPAMYNIARVLIFSVLSALFSEMLGFKLKLWKLLKFK